MTCAIDHAIDGTIPTFLCRACRPELRESWTPRGYHGSIIQHDEFRARYPLSERDQETIDRLRAIEEANAKTKALDRIATLKAKIAERNETKKPAPAPAAIVEHDLDLEDKPVVLHQQRKPGVISCIVEMMRRPNGATQAEILETLIKRFPDRDAKGMKSTTGIQSRKLCTSVDEEAERGLVFRVVVEG